jgi:hypothetical protein
MVMPHAGDCPAMQPGIPAGGIAASSVNEDSGIDLLRFLPWCKNLLVKIYETDRIY